MIWGSFSVWKPRLVFWCGALAIGVISVGFAKLADLAQNAFGSLTSSSQWTFLMPLLLTPAGFILSAYLAATLIPNSGGSGIPQAIAARHLHARKRTTPSRITRATASGDRTRLIGVTIF